MTNDNNKNRRNKSGKAKPTPRYASQYPDQLQGLPSNQYGGTNLRHQVGYKGAKFGPAGSVHIYSPQEIVDYANDNDLKVAQSVLQRLKGHVDKS